MSAQQPDFRAVHDALVAEMIARGKLIEAGWLGLRLLLPEGLTREQLDQIRLAYIGGAQHVWSAMFAALSADRDPTPADMRRMAAISHELEAAGTELTAWRDSVNFKRGH